MSKIKKFFYSDLAATVILVIIVYAIYVAVIFFSEYFSTL